MTRILAKWLSFESNHFILLFFFSLKKEKKKEKTRHLLKNIYLIIVDKRTNSKTQKMHAIYRP